MSYPHRIRLGNPWWKHEAAEHGDAAEETGRKGPAETGIVRLERRFQWPNGYDPGEAIQLILPDAQGVLAWELNGKCLPAPPGDAVWRAEVASLLQRSNQLLVEFSAKGEIAFRGAELMIDEAGVLWRPSPEQVAAANLTRFRQAVSADRFNIGEGYAGLHRWSLENPASFWNGVWDFSGVIASVRGEKVLMEGHRMPGARWFPEARLNYAENLLLRRDEAEAIVSWDERGPHTRWSFSQLHAEVSSLAGALRIAGVGVGDRVAGYMPNVPQTVAMALAAASVGAVWSSCSPDFGIAGVLDRFGQIEPKILLAADGYVYKGKPIDLTPRLRELADRLPSVQQVVVVSDMGESVDLSGIRAATNYEEFKSRGEGVPLTFEQLPFDHPLYILYSSGTTGVPKGIVHGAGGTLLQHLKELILHTDLKPDDRILYFTTCGWMMWNWLVSGLAVGATIVLYDGSPFHPKPDVLFDLAEQEKLTQFGTSAKYLAALEKAEVRPRLTHDLGSLRTILSTGSPLAASSFDYVYREIKSDVCLSSISGGTDIVSCFALGNPTAAVRRGELQAIGLGMAVEVFDESGKPVESGSGELVCTKPFPSMPVGFWNDPDGGRYRAAYFEVYPNVWRHGDFVERTPSGGLIVHGRSDAVLNPGGVRIGTAEIYRQVEQLPEVLESLAVGQPCDGDELVVLFVRLQEGKALTPEMEKRIRDQIRSNTTPRHVPARIVEVADLPRTLNGKLAELAVRDVLAGRSVRNVGSLANPESLEIFRKLSPGGV